MKITNIMLKRFSATLVILLMIAMLAVLSGCGKKKDVAVETEASAETEVQSQAIDNTVEWKGKKYTYNTNLTNVLFLGIDKSEDLDDSYIPGDAGQADCLMILSLDEETKEGRILQINRNTMTNLDVYDMSGNYLKSIDGQINLQYAYDIGGESSCWATKKTVSELLFGLEIDGYFTMDMDAIPTLNDAIGGVDITMKEDYTEIDPSYTEGATIHLEGEAAEQFVRYRNTDEFNSVEGRMHRQVEYITALITALRSQGGQKLYDIISPYLGESILTDLDAETLNALSSYQYLTDDVQYLPGEMKQGEIYEEYYLDEDALQDLLIATFYIQVDD